MLKALIPACVVALVLCGPAGAQDVEVDAGTLTVMGEAKISVENTAALVRFGVQIQASTSQAAVQQNSELLTEVFDAVAEHGIEKADMQTSGISLHQVMDRDREHIIAYKMTNTVEIYVDEIAELGNILSAATSAGINRIDSVQMVPAKDAVDHNELRRMAAQDARSKAELYAETLGLEIVGVSAISENAGHTPIYQPQARMMASADISVPVAGGSSDASSTLTVAYKVKLAE